MSKSHDPILPGATIGVLGSGQLGRMFTLAARRMGYRVITFSSDSDTPTGQVADEEITAPYGDLHAVAQFARRVSVVTFEFENVPAETARAAAQHAPVRPDGAILHTTQHRLREKTFLAASGFPVVPFCAVRSRQDLRSAVHELGLPAILKSASFGYDGKGQRKLSDSADVESAPVAGEQIFEAFVDFDCELSVIVARGIDGAMADWGVIENDHHNQILDVSVTPSAVDAKIAVEAVETARGIAEKLDVVGVLCVEFFLTRAGRLLVNELAPRPHNSGHWTIDASATSQFEQQLRAVCGLPLGCTRQLRPAAMANLLGDLWQHGTPRWEAALAMQDVKLHLYGKAEPRPGRKMGHLTALAQTPQAAAALARSARQALISPGNPADSAR